MASPGLHHEVLLKMRAKRDAKLEGEILAWIAEITGETIPKGEYEAVLKDGVLICKLMEKIQPGSIGKINQATGGNDLSHFKMVENISKFLNAILAYGVPELDIFKADDLVDHRNIPAVTSTICALGRTVSNANNFVFISLFLKSLFLLFLLFLADLADLQAPGIQAQALWSETSRSKKVNLKAFLWYCIETRILSQSTRI